MKPAVRVALMLVVATILLLAAPFATPVVLCESCSSPPPCIGRCPNGTWWGTYKQWCSRCGGKPYQNSSGGGCTPGPSWAGASANSGGSGGATLPDISTLPGISRSLSPQQQLGIGLLGMGLNAMMQGASEASARESQRRQQEMEEVRQREAAERARVQAEQARLAEEQHHNLLASLKSPFGGDFDGRAASDRSAGMEIKTGTSLFGIPANPVGNLQLEEVAYSDGAVKLPDGALNQPISVPSMKQCGGEKWSRLYSKADQLLCRAEEGLSKDQSNLAKVRDRIQVGQETDEYFRDNYGGFVQDPGVEKRVSPILDRFKGTSFQLEDGYVLKMTRKCLPFKAMVTGTSLYVDKCYLAKNPSDEELLITMGHELAHARLEHYERYRIHIDAQGLSDENDHNVIRRKTASYSRAQELEADVIGQLKAMELGASPKTVYAEVREEIEDRKKSLDALTPDERERVKWSNSYPEPEEVLQKLEEALGKKFWERP